MKNIKYSVLLAIEPESAYGAFIQHIASVITVSDGRCLLHLWCSEVNASDPHYLEVVAHKPTNEPGLHYRIPHHQVLMISDPPPPDKQIGFVYSC